MNIKIGANIKKLRTENNITQDALATAIGVTPQAVSRWENGETVPNTETLKLLSKELQLLLQLLLLQYLFRLNNMHLL